MLLSILFIILILLLLLPTMLLSIVSNILSLFGLKMGRNSRNKRTETKWENTSGHNAEANGTKEKKRTRKKIFDKDDGEYVDFEEIK